MTEETSELSMSFVVDLSIVANLHVFRGKSSRNDLRDKRFLGFATIASLPIERDHTIVLLHLLQFLCLL